MKRIIFIFLLQTVFFCSYSQTPTEFEFSSNSDELLNIYFSEKGIYGHSVEDYFKKPKIDLFKLSPDGLHLSFLKTDYEGKKNLFVENTETGKVTRVIDAGSEIITDYNWVNNNYINYFKTKGDLYNYDLFSISISGRHNKHVASFKDEIPSLLDILKEEKAYSIVEIKKRDETFSKPYIFNRTTGEKSLIKIGNKSSHSISRYIFDNQGELKGYEEIVNSVDRQLFYRTSASEPFEKKLRYNWKTDFKIIDFDYTTPNPNDVLVITNIKNNTDEVLRYDLKKDIILKTLFTNKDYDISGIQTSIIRNHEIDFYHYTLDKKQVQPISKQSKKIYKKIKDTFKDKNCSIISITEDETKYLLYISSDIIYGKYFIYNVVKDEFRFIKNTMKHLKKKEMVKMKSYRFKCRDGLTIHYYLTLPEGSIKGNKIPMIVKPHNQIFSSRDTWDYDREAQLFASRGYATLHVNFRGSKGYGKKFGDAGYKQVGRKIIEDIEDAVLDVIKKGIIDKNRIAIYGEKSGGLIALQAVIKNPDMFNCAVNKFGPCSIISVLENIDESSKEYLPQYYEQIYDISNAIERQIAIEVSPLNNADKIKKPIFIVESIYSDKYMLEEANQLVGKLKDNNIDYYFVLDKNSKRDIEKSEIEYYKALLGFFSKYLKN